MAVLVVDRRDTVLDCAGGRLAVRVPEQPVRHVPLALIDRVVVNAGISLSSRVLCELARVGAPVMLFRPRRQELAAILLPAEHKDVRIRQGQFLLAGDNALRIRLVMLLLRARARAQLRQCRQALSARPAQRRSLKAIERELVRFPARLGEGSSMDGLRGQEGCLARLDFDQLRALLPASAGFEGRNRRPPRDPANALISLGATLLIAEATASCWRAGLDPYLGFYHEPAHGRPALACDLVEPLRPALHAWIAALFNSQALRDRDFSQDEQNGCRLRKAGRERFYAQWVEWSRSPAGWLRRRSSGLARLCRDRGHAQAK